MNVFRDGVIAFFSAVGMTTVVWLLAGAVLHAGRPTIPGLLLVLPTGLPVSAASSFDAGYYATHYPDVAAACGTDEGALLQHYIRHGPEADRRPDRGHLVAGAHQGTGQL